MPKKTRKEVDDLKQSWKRDPIWDLENSEGFEEYREELLKFTQECKSQWAERDEAVHYLRVQKICPVMTSGLSEEGYVTCLVERCARWNDQLGVCGDIAEGHLAGIQFARAER